MESLVLKVVIVMAFLLASTSAGNFYRDVIKTFGDVRIDQDGNRLSLSLNKYSGSGVESYKSYLFGRIDVQIKLITGNSAGTVATFYLKSQEINGDEIDIEFLGNSSGKPYTVHTNVFTQGVGEREQQFRLWFDPTKAYHTYTILWNPLRIIFMVDNTAIRVFNNYKEKYGVPYPTSQYMKMYATLWNADDWATQGGRVKTNWTQAPFKASYTNLNINGCVKKGKSSSCDGKSKQAWQTQGLNAEQKTNLKLFQKTQMIYNYCKKAKKFPKGRLPKECGLEEL